MRYLEMKKLSLVQANEIDTLNRAYKGKRLNFVYIYIYMNMRQASSYCTE